jgi:hypothetical protein
MYSREASAEIEKLQWELSYFQIKAARFSYAMAEELRARVIRNIDNTFGARTKNASPGEVKRLSARKLGASGNLRNSVVLSKEGPYQFGVTVGNEQVPYAAIHEYGGPIYPKNGRYLTIPASFRNGSLVFFNEITSGHRAREFDLVKVGHFLIFKRSYKQARRKSFAGDIAYWLAERVNMPARPYARPAVESLEKDLPFIEEQMLLAGLSPELWRQSLV